MSMSMTPKHSSRNRSVFEFGSEGRPVKIAAKGGKRQRKRS
jgi:hypothetical protein